MLLRRFVLFPGIHLISLIVAAGFLLALVPVAHGQTSQRAANQKLRFEISFPASLGAQPVDGHIMLGISRDKDHEPRFQLDEEEASSAQFFGLDVDGWKPEAPAIIDSSTLGYPHVSLDQLL